MELSKRLGCLHCGRDFEVTSPDDFYIEVHRKYIKDSLDDMIPMKAKCLWCEEDNHVFWYKPSS